MEPPNGLTYQKKMMVGYGEARSVEVICCVLVTYYLTPDGSSYGEERRVTQELPVPIVVLPWR
jgi:hypothetical protein